MFKEFPRPWRHEEKTPGRVVCADGSELLVIDLVGERSDEAVLALAEIIVQLGNRLPESGPHNLADRIPI